MTAHQTPPVAEVLSNPSATDSATSVEATIRERLRDELLAARTIPRSLAATFACEGAEACESIGVAVEDPPLLRAIDIIA